MKKLLIQLIVIAGLPLLSFAQQFQGGLLAGIVGSQVAGDTYSGYTKVGISAGGYVGLKLDPKYSLQLEMEYIMKGSRHNENTDIPNDFTYKLNLNYIEIPLLLRYNVMDKFDLEAGLAMAVLVSHKETQNDQEMKNIPGFKSTNLSVVGGFSYLYKDRYRFVLRTDNSLQSIRDGVVYGSVKRFGNTWGQYHDLLVISLYYKL